MESPRQKFIRDLRCLGSQGARPRRRSARRESARRQSARRARSTTMRDDEPPLPPPSPAPVHAGPSRLRRTLHTLRSPFRPGSPFHIGSIKRSGSIKSVLSDGEISRDERTMRKRNKKYRDAASDASRSTDSSPGTAVVDKKKKDGNLLRRMGSMGKKRIEEVAKPSPKPDTSKSTLEPPPALSFEPEPQKETEQLTPEPASPIAVEHPVATRPFTKAAWKRNSEPEMEKPVEEPSPGNALRRRITIAAQASTCLSEDRDDGERGASEVGSLEEAVALARVKLAAAAPPSPSQPRDNHAEVEGCSDAMPAYGDLIEPESKGSEPAPVSGCG
ncbi:hypothetical protein O3G_MSEX000086 [Manduca sexta]|nr:hypothetical protein O3G_MSEX000086 [Manduca sexta]